MRSSKKLNNYELANLIIKDLDDSQIKKLSSELDKKNYQTLNKKLVEIKESEYEDPYLVSDNFIPGEEKIYKTSSIEEVKEIEIKEETNMSSIDQEELVKIRTRNKKDVGFNRFLKVLTYILLILWGLAVIFPFYYMIITSFKSFGSYATEFSPSLIPLDPTFDNYVSAFTEVHLLKYMLNTLIFALATTALMVVVTVLAAYGFARIKFKGRDFIFTLFLAMMMIPTELVVITNYTTIVNLGWRNTLIGLVLPSITSVFYIYLLRENFMQVGDSIYYAAKIDGCTDFGYLMKIIVPINKSTIISITILKLIECWNSYIWPRLVTTEEGRYLVSNGIQEIRANGFGRDNVPAMMASVVLVSLPLLLLFIIFRKQIMTGVIKSGTKG